jgi:hypothetical protein
MVSRHHVGIGATLWQRLIPDTKMSPTCRGVPQVGRLSVIVVPTTPSTGQDGVPRARHIRRDRARAAIRTGDVLAVTELFEPAMRGTSCHEPPIFTVAGRHAFTVANEHSIMSLIAVAWLMCSWTP